MGLQPRPHRCLANRPPNLLFTSLRASFGLPRGSPAVGSSVAERRRRPKPAVTYGAWRRRASPSPRSALPCRRTFTDLSAVTISVGHRRPAKNEQRPEHQEADVVCPLMGDVFADVVDREDVVIHDSLHEVEQSPAGEHPADECASAECPAPVFSSTPEDP